MNDLKRILDEMKEESGLYKRREVKYEPPEQDHSLSLWTKFILYICVGVVLIVYIIETIQNYFNK